ncbi:hypothetical protein CYMTET_5464 [Cymbomonas tetramitiformis]|uniref:DNA methylase N-4/N-6 domain-containing protein n=1 Tax=Cymbomonas tetramitiformis TaxID=36881 RepID=A0AAE0GZ22_9CHLO|nr:hypothetical protein CYMTET_5464 [Cymbomonas tetramitiformis]
MDEVAAELEEKDAHDQELEEKLKAKLEEKAAELRAAKLQKKALEEEVEKEEEEEVPEPLDLSNVYVDKVLATGGPLRNGTEPVFDEAHADELMLSFIALRWTSLEYENDYPVYVEVKTSTEMKKDAKGVAKKKQQAPEPKIMFRLRKHKMAGAVQDPVILTSRAVIGADKHIIRKAVLAKFGTEFENVAGMVMDPFMGSGSGGIAALRKGRCFLGYEQKQANFFSAAFHLNCALQKMIEGDDDFVLYKYEVS